MDKRRRSSRQRLQPLTRCWSSSSRCMRRLSSQIRDSVEQPEEVNVELGLVLSAEAGDHLDLSLAGGKPQTLALNQA